MGITRKFEARLRPSMSLIIEPSVIPSAAKGMAIMRYEAECRHETDPVLWPEAGENAHQKDQRSLEHADGCSAERAANHEINARHRRNQGLLQESELAIPEHPIPENIELKSTVMPITPGATNCR